MPGGYLEVFSEEWARTWGRALNEDSGFQAAAENWEGDVAVVMTKAGKSGEQRAVRVDIRRGECLAAHVATAEEVTASSYVLEGSGAVWGEVLSGRQNPLLALMTGKLRLTKGNLSALIPYGAMARELIRLAVEMNGSVPEGWG